MKQKQTRVRSFTLSGYFNESDCKALKEAMQGRSYYDFKISWSNSAGNCTVIVETTYPHGTITEARRMFECLAYTELAARPRPLAYALTHEEVQIVLKTLTDGEPATGFEIKPYSDEDGPVEGVFEATAFVRYSDTNLRRNRLWFKVATEPGRSEYFDGFTRLRFVSHSSGPLYPAGGRAYVDQSLNRYIV